MSSDKSKEYNNGYRHFVDTNVNGIADRTLNPYPSSTVEYYAWNNGFNEAEDTYWEMQMEPMVEGI